MFDVITIGSSTRDVFLKSDNFIEVSDPQFEGGKAECFALGAKVEIGEIAFATGGGGTNSAVTFARQGYKTSCIGVIGKDVAGDAIIRELHNEGVDTKMFQIHDDGNTAYSTILVSPSGSRTILSYKGEGQHFNADMAPDKFDSDWLYVDSLGGKIDLLIRIMESAGKDVKVAFNPGGKMIDQGVDNLKDILKNVTIFISNKEEGARLLGIESATWMDVAKNLKEYIPGIVSVSDGPNGIIVIDDYDKVYKAGVPDSPVIERTGAGDAFGSGFVSEYMRSQDIEKSIQFATANATSVVAKFGAKEGILKEGDTGEYPLIDVETGI